VHTHTLGNIDKLFCKFIKDCVWPLSLDHELQAWSMAKYVRVDEWAGMNAALIK